MSLVRLRNPRAEPRRCSRRPLIASVQTLRGGGNLHADNVTGCGGLINNGDVLTYGSHVNIVAPSHFAVNAITSP